MNRIVVYRIAFAFVLLSCLQNAIGQSKPLLERTLTIALNNERVDAALKKISEQGGFVFSYSPSIFDSQRRLTYSFVNKTVREILDEIFSGRIEYKARGKYIILTKALLSSSKDSKVYSGYVVDESTGERLKDVAIYDPVSLSSTLTDSYGFFELKIDKPPSDLKLVVNKRNYSDTLVVTPSRTGRLLTVRMRETTGKIATFADSVGRKVERFWKSKILLRQVKTMENVSDTLHRLSQISFVPFIGTNHALSGNVVNDFSFNVVGGYSLGIKKFEMGGVFNIVRSNVQGFQIAGVFNAVGGNVTGGQFAGVFNANRGSFQGAQLAGILNFNWEGTKYFNGAGILNFNRKVSDAIQFAGIANVTVGEQKLPHFAGIVNLTTSDASVQFSGIGNIAAKSMDGWQASGIVNFVGKNVDGVQTSGILNLAGKDVKGAQVAGVLNFTGKKVEGVQISSILNYATKVDGVQIGLINVADSVGGLSIGLLSVVLKGYHKIELAADEVFMANVSFRTGVRQFYNIVTVGAKPQTFSDTVTHWTFGYGLGSAPRLSEKLFLNLDATANQIVQGGKIESLNLLNKFYLGVDYQFARHMSVTAGATFNIYVTELDYEQYWEIFPNSRPKFLHNQDHGNDTNVKMWIGGKIGIRFL